jgi:fused signal recognition particle receptor
VEESLARTRVGWRERLASVFGPVDITPATWDALEERLIEADVGARTAGEIVASTRELARDAGVRRASELWSALRRVLVNELERSGPGDEESPARGGPPHVILTVGVNGGGKTTSVAKLARRELRAGRRPLLVAADTFRAAAIDQLTQWAARLDVPIVAGQPGADPAAAVFDALQSRAAAQADTVIIDTAGRLHTQPNLMAELAKIERVAARGVAGAPHEVLLVLDATTGQNGLAQAKAFAAAVHVSGLVLAKLDSTAKGGIALAVRRELGVPVRFVGTGEQADDLQDFVPQAYADGLLGMVEVA